MLRVAVGAVLLSILAGACGGGNDATLTIYTSVTQDTVESVVAGFSEVAPEVEVIVFRAPTGELTARIAAELASGDLGADVLWLTEPLSMYRYREQGLLEVWQPSGADALPSELVEDAFWGTRRMHMVVVTGSSPPVEIITWDDTRNPDLRVVIPDPGFAGSALAVLGYVALTPGLGMDFYRDLAANGAVQVSSPGDVITAVAEGRFDAGITLEQPARVAAAAGSPLRIVWPSPGAITFGSPIAVVEGASDRAEEFVEYVLSEAGQTRIAATGWFPARPGVSGPEPPPGAGEVFPDWASLSRQESGLLDEYRSIFDG
jgi:iron(III) transport system substrate-binding protein